MGRQSFWVRIVVTVALVFDVAAMAGCASLDKMAHDQDVYNQNRCQQFGLAPGSPQYVQCVSQGANAYAAAQKNATAAPATTAVWPGAVVAVAPSHCSAAADSDNVCAGCSVSCPSGQQASCTEGEVHKTDGFSPVCWTKSKCECH
jgi:hypothetical protein